MEMATLASMMLSVTWLLARTAPMPRDAGPLRIPSALLGSRSSRARFPGRPPRALPTASSGSAPPPGSRASAGLHSRLNRDADR